MPLATAGKRLLRQSFGVLSTRECWEFFWKVSYPRSSSSVSCCSSFKRTGVCSLSTSPSPAQCPSLMQGKALRRGARRWGTMLLRRPHPARCQLSTPSQLCRCPTNPWAMASASAIFTDLLPLPPAQGQGWLVQQLSRVEAEMI